MSEDVDFSFSQIPIPERQPKPRTRGLTMMIDWGLPLGLQLDCIQTHGIYVDEAKIAAGIPRVMPAALLKKKIEIYGSHQIPCFPGGLFTELAIAQGNYDQFLAEAHKVGFKAIEVSDNLLTLNAKDKRRYIRRAVEGFGLTVMGEVGRKEGSMPDAELIADVENCLEAGASYVLLEAHELFHGAIRQDVIDALTRRVPANKLMFELPVVVLPDVTRDFKNRVCSWLVQHFGTEVNLANIEWDEIYFTEIVRRGMGGDTSHPDGAYRLAGISTY
ncbi:MAG: phosphosulfolactate synthase [Desulfobacterales bacterium]